MPRAPAKRVDSKTSSDGLTDPDRALLELVRSKKDMGIMRFDMRRESQLQDHVITKSVKTLLAKKVIKEVINIHNKRGKCYMAVEFQPSVELTGGAFYNDGKLDAELINHLKKLCLKIITKMKVATLENIVGSVNKYGLVKFEITLKQIQEIVGTLILDKDVEELKSSETGDFADIPRGKTCYKCLNSAGVEKVGALGSIPCGVCPRISDCTPDGVISPKTCVYYTKCCIQCSDFATGFARKVDYLWKFLDSTSAAFKGRECEFRRIVEGEAAMALVNRGELNEAKDKWCERIGGVGFSGEGFGEDAIDGGRALLRKYDSNWEMRVDEKDGFARLWWKGQPVSFCSLWTLEKKAVSDS